MVLDGSNSPECQVGVPSQVFHIPTQCIWVGVVVPMNIVSVPVPFGGLGGLGSRA